MYTSFTARKFRCFKNLTVEPIGQINLIAGKNNVGKTAFLEALFLHSGAYNPGLAFTVNAIRGIEFVKVDYAQSATFPWDSLFYQFDTSEGIELISQNTRTGPRWFRLRVVSGAQDLDGLVQPSLFSASDIEAPTHSLKTSHVLELEYQEGEDSGSSRLIVDKAGVRIEPLPPTPPFPGFFLSAHMRQPPTLEAERFGNLEVQGKQGVLLRILKQIEPRLNRLAVIVTAGQAMLHGDIGMGRMIPLLVMGDGMGRLVSLVLHIANASDGVVLVDEIENGLHYSVLPLVWQAIWEVAQEFNVQIFATTHSFECIKAAYEVFKDKREDDFRLHRLNRIDDNIQAVTFSKKQLATAMVTDLELR